MVRGERVSVIAAISMKGLIDLQLCRGGVDSERFTQFVSKRLLLHLYPFDGYQSVCLTIAVFTIQVKLYNHYRSVDH